MHNPFVPPKGKLVEFWRILEQLKDDGTISASLGVSNFRPQVRLPPSPLPWRGSLALSTHVGR